MENEAKAFDISKLSEELKSNCPEISFAILHGSSVHGIVNKGKDIDIAVYLNTKQTLDIYLKIANIVVFITYNF